MAQAEVNGLSLYYELHGTGEPLVLLHGGLGAIEMFGPVPPALAEGRQVIAVDLPALGRTADTDRPLRLESMADDIAALIGYLGLERADVMGYSLGGRVALLTAIRHASMVRRLVLVSTPFATDGWYPEIQAGMAQLGPAVEDYDHADEVSWLPMPTMLVVGDADAVRPAHVVEFFALLGGGQRDAGWDGTLRPESRLAVLPGRTHYDVFAAPELAAAVTPFLDA
jgi:pimeloyl-ACP methyl ester carboxylesterase